MLNHEEMIKNVHRRIAQYEEEKKNKKKKNIKKHIKLLKNLHLYQEYVVEFVHKNLNVKKNA